MFVDENMFIHTHTHTHTHTLVPPLTVFSIVKVAVFLMPTGTLRKIMAFLRKITVCLNLLPPLKNKLRLKSI